VRWPRSVGLGNQQPLRVRLAPELWRKGAVNRSASSEASKPAYDRSRHDEGAAGGAHRRPQPAGLGMSSLGPLRSRSLGFPLLRRRAA